MNQKSMRVLRAWRARQQSYLLLICNKFLTLVAQSPSVGRDLVAVSTKQHAAPTSMMRFGVVREPEHARLVLAPFHQTKVGRCKQISGSFSDGSKNGLDGIVSSDFFDLRRARLVPNKSGMALGARQKSI
jgi:hypothetical protein